MELRDKVMLITGGASGLGRASALALAERGAEIVIADVQDDAGRAVAEQVGGHFVHADVSRLEDNEAMVAFATERCGGLDVAFLNAGMVSGTAPGENFDLERYRLVMSVNLDGVVFGTQAALPALRARGGGAILMTASLAGLVGLPLDPLYSANKHAVVGLARALGPGLAPEGIRVNALCPGFAETAIVDGIRDEILAGGFPIMPAEHVADAVVEVLAGDSAGEAWVVQPGRGPIAFQFRNVPGPR
jgi:NAD(P)-dependent dehydrogenase (short-subunit alcohol dehydrogenase family)